MEFNIKAAPSKAYIETLRRWLQMLVELHELLDKLYTMMVERGRQNLQ